jgi:tetratricopeptide (TPR) repeat protein
MIRRLVAGVLLAAAMVSSAYAETVDEAYARALRDYYAGRYDKAVEGMERLLAVPVEHEDVHYNLGCAYFRSDKLGPAIYHFERAMALDPGAEDARFNLDTSRALVAARVKDEIKGAASEPWWVRLVSTLSLRSWAIIFLGLWWATLGVLFALRYTHAGPARAGLIAVNSILAGLALSSALLLAGRVYLGRRVPSGIVLPDQLAVREGPDASTKISFTVHAGLRVRLQARGDGWMRVRLANGLEGWVPQREIGAL